MAWAVRALLVFKAVCRGSARYRVMLQDSPVARVLLVEERAVSAWLAAPTAWAVLPVPVVLTEWAAPVVLVASLAAVQRHYNAVVLE